MKHMNGDRYFIDTNVILYAYDPRNLEKRQRAGAWLDWLWRNTAGSLSWQVLQEFYVNAVKKFGADPEEVRLHAQILAEFGPPDVTLGLLQRAWYWTDHADVAFWDAMIVAAAERTKCRWLLSEDFQAGREFGSLTVVSPFDKAPEFDQV